MARLDFCICCILYVNLSLVLSVPLLPVKGKIPTQTPKSTDRFLPPSVNRILKQLKGKTAPVLPASQKSSAKQQTHAPVYPTSGEDGGSSEGGSGFGDLEKLTSITDRIQEQDMFSPNGSIDYDSMDFPAPKPLVDASQASKPSETLTELAFREMHERAQFMRITEVKESILSKLRLLAPPNITALKLNNKLKQYPDHILPRLPNQQEDLQQDAGNHREDTFHAKINTIIQFASAFPEEKKTDEYPTDSIAYFSLPLTVSEKNIQKVTLMVYIATPAQQEGKKIKLIISDAMHQNKPFVNRTVTLTSRGHWEHIDISQMLRVWAADDSNNYGLFVSALLGTRNIAYLNEDPLEMEKDKIYIGKDITARPQRTPLIKIILNEQPGRYRRSFDEVPLSCDIKDKDNRCCRYKFVIDFQQMGKDFDFIIQPRRYLANYCAGTCPTYYLPKDANSKMLMGLVKPKLQRCCSPMTKKALTILYYDEEGSMMLGEIPDMSIEKCYCS